MASNVATNAILLLELPALATNTCMQACLLASHMTHNIPYKKCIAENWFSVWAMRACITARAMCIKVKHCCNRPRPRKTTPLKEGADKNAGQRSCSGSEIHQLPGKIEIESPLSICHALLQALL